MAKLRAPTGNGEVLAVPGFDAIPALVEANRRKLDRDDVKIGGMSLRELRALARREVMELVSDNKPAAQARAEPSPLLALRACEGPLLLAGHQPELSHPGVWVKNFALNGLAKKLGGIGLNLIVDNDTLKSTAIRFPTFRDRDPKSVHMQSVAFDTFAGEVPYESRTVIDTEQFRTFADRATPLWTNWGYEPLLQKFWTDVLNSPQTKPDPGNWDEGVCQSCLGERFVDARRQMERRWGCANLELPVQSLSWTNVFALFVRHILADLPRFQEVYNGAVHRYRLENGIQSANHPVPDLRRDGDWHEAPFWIWRFQSKRRPLMSRRSADRHELQLENSGEPSQWWDSGDMDQWVKGWNMLTDLGYRIRPRALTLTLFARVCLGDFFIHGIGGGKYDEVTDAIIRDYFGIEPPAYQVLSATLHLPLPGFPSTPNDLKQAERLVRDLHWNPQRHLPVGQASSLSERKAALAAAEPPHGDRAARREWFRQLRDVTERLRPLVAEQLPVAEAKLERVRAEVEANAVLQRRDYPWVLYPEETLKPFLQRFLEMN